jgi:hypothetical protein
LNSYRRFQEGITVCCAGVGDNGARIPAKVFVTLLTRNTRPLSALDFSALIAKVDMPPGVVCGLIPEMSSSDQTPSANVEELWAASVMLSAE